MTRRDFEAVASAIAGVHRQHCEANNGSGVSATVQAAEAIADRFGATYPRFDRARFLRASVGAGQ